MSIELERIHLKYPPIYGPRNSPVKVYSASIEGTSEEIVVKVISMRTKRETQKYLVEAQVMYKFDHPNLMKLLAYFEKKSSPELWLVMELCKNGDLTSEIIRRNPSTHWSEQELWGIFKQLIDACAYLQKHGFAHRDIKPQNILVGNDGLLKLADFGATKEQENFVKAIDSCTLTLQGTPIYLSPKLRQLFQLFITDSTRTHTKHNAIKSDVYSLGITFLCMIFLREPRELATLNDLQGKIERCLNQIQFPRIKDLISKMLIIEENDRPTFLDIYAAYFQEQSIETDNVRLLLEAIADQNTENAEKLLVRAINKETELDLAIEASEHQVENFISSVELNAGTLQICHRIGVDLNKKVFVEVSKKCCLCLSGVGEIKIMCCSWTVHRECLFNELKARDLCEWINCCQCGKTNWLCFYCNNFFPKTEFLNCHFHRACALCKLSSNGKCIQNHSRIMRPITQYRFKVYVLFRFCPNLNCEFKEFFDCQTTYFECEYCNHIYCTICKGTYHQHPCCNNQINDYMKCFCGGSAIRYSSTGFYNCSKCGYLCLVCQCPSETADHRLCANLYNGSEILN